MRCDKTSGIPMPDWVKPLDSSWTFVGWWPRNPLLRTFEELVETAQQSDHGELREVDIYPEGAAALEEWAERFAPHHFSAWEYSDASEYMDFWEWLDLNHPDILEEFEQWFKEERDASTD